MTQTCESSTRFIPARLRTPEALPVLISIPNLAAATRATRPRRRRLRREVRAVGYAMLVIFPLAMALITFGGGKRPAEASSPVADRPAATTGPAAVISLAPLEPVIAARREVDAPVFFPGYLLPADAAEESSDGGH